MPGELVPKFLPDPENESRRPENTLNDFVYLQAIGNAADADNRLPNEAQRIVRVALGMNVPQMRELLHRFRGLGYLTPLVSRRGTIEGFQIDFAAAVQDAQTGRLMVSPEDYEELHIRLLGGKDLPGDLIGHGSPSLPEETLDDLNAGATTSTHNPPAPGRKRASERDSRLERRRHHRTIGAADRLCLVAVKLNTEGIEFDSRADALVAIYDGAGITSEQVPLSTIEPRLEEVKNPETGKLQMRLSKQGLQILKGALGTLAAEQSISKG